MDAANAPPWPRCTPADLLELMAGNEHAVKLVQDIVFLSHVYDDLIDKDKDVSEEKVHALMYKLLVALPLNEFYRQHEPMFRAVILTGTLNWRAANEMEATREPEEWHLAHVLRYQIADVAMLAMALAGGNEHAARNARRCRLLSQSDTWTNYRNELEVRHAQDSPLA